MLSMKKIEAFAKKVWLSSPTMHGDEIEYIRKAYESNWMSTIGENINETERLVCQQVGCKYAVALTCGTAAVHMAVRLAGVKPGDKVFCSDMTFIASVNPVVYEGGIPVFIDTERDTWNMDPVALEKAFSLYPEVKTVVLVHLYGTPAKLDEIKAVCDRHGAILIEDAAESLGASYRGQQTGSFGAIGCISFNGNKIITGSSGGVLLTDDEEAAAKARKWSTQSRENAPWYQHEELGYNYRMSNVIAGVVRGQFPYLETHIAQKKAIYERYREGLKDLPVSMNPIDTGKSVPNYWLSCLLLDEDAMSITSPMEILTALAQHNAEGRPIWKPMHMQPLFQDTAFVSCDASGDASADIFRRGLCLPSDNKMTVEEQNTIIQIIKNCFK